jgi:sporulation protein YlmC with PRC-barrel domain
MLFKATDLMGMTVHASDGEVGTTKDLFFDDQRWGIRYLVVDAGRWLASRKVLISPFSVLRGRPMADGVHVSLTREQVRHSPGVDADKPISRHYEIAHALHYGYPTYWSGPLLWGGGLYPDMIPVGPSEAEPGSPRFLQEQAAQAEIEQAAQSHLHSARVVLGYDLETSDGHVGAVEDFLIDSDSWGIVQIAVDARKWWPGGRTTIEPQAVTLVDWGARCVRLNITKDDLQHLSEAPEAAAR